MAIKPVDDPMSLSCSSEADLRIMEFEIDRKQNRYPYCIVWTPIPILTWWFPFIGHMGICMSNGVIRDFAGSYFVSEDNMGFGNPTRYLQMKPENAKLGQNGWDRAVIEASEVYKGRMHNLFCDNCHSHVALALEKMEYNGLRSWNMVKLAYMMFIFGKYVSFSGFLKTWLPFLIFVSVVTIVCVLTP